MALTRCCCCFDLRTGVQVLAILSFLISTGFLIGFSTHLSVGEENQTQLGSHFNKVSPGVIFDSVVSMVICVSLLYGTTTGKRSFILPWLVAKMLTIIGTCLFALIFIIVLAGIHEARPDEPRIAGPAELQRLLTKPNFNDLTANPGLLYPGSVDAGSHDEGHAEDSVSVGGILLAIIAVSFAVIIGLELYFWFTVKALFVLLGRQAKQSEIYIVKV